MKLHDTQITNYLTFCKSQKCLDVKTIRAYKIDLTHFRTYIITHDRGQREAASISVFHLFINGIVRAHDRRKSTEQD
jgi:site-specific recombinase XerD